MRNKVFITSFVLIFLSLLLAIYRHIELDIPLVPKALNVNQTVQVQLKAKLPKGIFKVTLNVPSKRYSPNIINENFNSEGYAMASFYNNEKRYIKWSGKINQAKELAFYYNVEIKPGLNNLYASPSIERFTYGFPALKSDKERLDTFLNYTRKSNSKDITFLKKLRDCIVSASCEKGEFFARYKYSNKKQALILRYLYERSGFSAIVARGFLINKKAYDSQLKYFVRVKRQGQWKNYLLNKNTLSNDYIFWDYYQQNEGNKNYNINYSISNNYRYAINSEMKQKEFKHDFFRVISLKNLPLSTQLSFKILLLFPIGALIICFLRNIIGIPTFGTFLPILTAISYRDMGLVWGILLLSTLIIAGIFVRVFLAKLRLLMVPRVSATLTIVIILIVFFTLLANTFNFYPALSIRFFPLVIITLLIERISISLDEVGYKKTFILYILTIFASIVAYIIMDSQFLAYTITNYPELILCILSLIILIGRYTGMRVLEYYRFRTFFKKSNNLT